MGFKVGDIVKVNIDGFKLSNECYMVSRVYVDQGVELLDLVINDLSYNGYKAEWFYLDVKGMRNSVIDGVLL